MRTKDEKKKSSLFKATVTLVNRIGFTSSSVSKIAKEAGVSPATIYVYHSKKDELLVSVYISIKKRMADDILAGFDDSRPVRDTLKQAWFNAYTFGTNHTDYIQYIEQFANSPYVDLVDRSAIEKPFLPLFQVIQHGIERKIIKNAPFDALNAFFFHPAVFLSNAKHCTSFENTKEAVETAFTMAWDAIRR